MSQIVYVGRAIHFVADANEQTNIYGNPDFAKVFFYDDFVNKALNTTNDYTTQIDTDSVVAVSHTSDGPGLTLTTQATANKVCAVAGNLAWFASKKPCMEVKFKIDVITSVCINIGFTDATSESAGISPFEISGTTIADTATDAAMFVFDTDQTTDTWVCCQTKAGTQTGLWVSNVPVAATYATFRVSLDASGNATYSIDNKVVGYRASAVTTTVGLCPYVGIQNRTTAARVGKMAMLRCWQDANVAD